MSDDRLGYHYQLQFFKNGVLDRVLRTCNDGYEWLPPELAKYGTNIKDDVRCPKCIKIFSYKAPPGSVSVPVPPDERPLFKK